MDKRVPKCITVIWLKNGLPNSNFDLSNKFGLKTFDFRILNLYFALIRSYSVFSISD